MGLPCMACHCGGRGCMLWSPEPGGRLFQAMAGVASTRAAVQRYLEPRGALHSYWTCQYPIRTFWTTSYMGDPDWRVSALSVSEDLCHLPGPPYEGGGHLRFSPRFKAGLPHMGHSSKPLHRNLPSANTALGLLLFCSSCLPRKKPFAQVTPHPSLTP